MKYLINNLIMVKLAETLIRTKEGMGYVPCYRAVASFLKGCDVQRLLLIHFRTMHGNGCV